MTESLRGTDHHVVRLQVSEQRIHAQMHMFQSQEDLGDPGHCWAGGLVPSAPEKVAGPQREECCGKGNAFWIFQMYPKFECPAFNFNFLLGLQAKQSATTCHKKVLKIMH